jgi:Fic family protein
MMFPKVTYEEHVWEPTIDLGTLDVWQKIQIEKPYKAAVLQAIADVPVSVPDPIKDLYYSAIESIVRFDTELSKKAISMPKILLRSESASSSQIEHLSASARNIAMAEIGQSDKRNAIEIAGNIKAMEKALAVSDSVSIQSIKQIHYALLQNVDSEIAGEIRTKQVWVGGRGISPHSADFVPPHAANVPGYLADLIKFANRDDIHALLRTAVAHCQFETIHPFLDGNGRTGRALMQVMLASGGLIRKSALPISAGLLANTSKYFDALSAYREGDYAPITEQICLASLDAVTIGRRTLLDFENLQGEWRERATARKDALVWKLIDLLLSSPVVDVKFAVSELSASDPAVRTAIDQCLETGILKVLNNKKRDVLYEAPEVLKLFDRFAAEIGRRATA